MAFVLTSYCNNKWVISDRSMHAHKQAKSNQIRQAIRVLSLDHVHGLGRRSGDEARGEAGGDVRGEAVGTDAPNARGWPP